MLQNIVRVLIGIGIIVYISTFVIGCASNQRCVEYGEPDCLDYVKTHRCYEPCLRYEHNSFPRVDRKGQ